MILTYYVAIIFIYIFAYDCKFVPDTITKKILYTTIIYYNKS